MTDALFPKEEGKRAFSTVFLLLYGRKRESREPKTFVLSIAERKTKGGAKGKRGEAHGAEEKTRTSFVP